MGAIQRDDEPAEQPVDRLTRLLDLPGDSLLGLEDRWAAPLAEGVCRLLRSAELDDLTGALRRASGERALRRELARARRTEAPLAVGFVDVDRFKELNDRDGHAAGDRALRTLVDAFASRLRPYDILARWGGDEFVCVLPGCGLEEAERIVAGVRAEFERRTRCTFTVGFAGGASLGADQLLTAADRALYARKNGRGARRGGPRRRRPSARAVGAARTARR